MPSVDMIPGASTATSLSDAPPSTALSSWSSLHSRASAIPFTPMIMIEIPTAASMYVVSASRLSAERRQKASAPTSAAPMPCPSPGSEGRRRVKNA